MRNKIGILILSCALLMTRCYTPRYVYSPSAHNVPFTQEKGESKIAIAYSSNLLLDARDGINQHVHKSSGIDIQAAYAITDNWIVTGNYFGRNEKNGGTDNLDIFDSSVIQYNRHLTGVGVGYNVLLNTEKTLYFTALVGIEMGRFKFTDRGMDYSGDLYNRFHNAGITKFYLQPVLMFKNKKNFKASLSNRFTAVKFRDIKTDYTTEELNRYQLDSLSRSLVYFWEPAFINAIGTKKIPGLWLEYQMGFSMLLNKRFVDARSFNFSIGLVADMGKWKKKKSADKKEEGLK